MTNGNVKKITEFLMREKAAGRLTIGNWYITKSEKSVIINTFAGDKLTYRVRDILGANLSEQV